MPRFAQQWKILVKIESPLHDCGQFGGAGGGNEQTVYIYIYIYIYQFLQTFQSGSHQNIQWDHQGGGVISIFLQYLNFNNRCMQQFIPAGFGLTCQTALKRNWVLSLASVFRISSFFFLKKKQRRFK